MSVQWLASHLEYDPALADRLGVATSFCVPKARPRSAVGQWVLRHLFLTGSARATPVTCRREHN